MVTTGEFDLIPDYLNWKDSGCELFDSCLSCPRTKCIEEEPHGRQKRRMNARANRMAALKGQGKSAKEIARLFEVSIRTVQRSLAAKKDANVKSLRGEPVES